MTVGEKIRNYRNERKLTQKQLGELVGSSEAMIRQYELGLRNPKIETVEKIAEALKVSPTNIMELKYFDKKLDTNKIQEDIKFIEYLESIGYTIQLKQNATEWKTNPDGSKYPIAYDESPNAPYCILIKDEIISSFTNQQFENFQSNIVKSIQYHAFEYRKK